MSKMCLISHFASEYRTANYIKINKELNCDFVFGGKCDDIRRWITIGIPNYNPTNSQYLSCKRK